MRPENGFLIVGLALVVASCGTTTGVPPTIASTTPPSDVVSVGDLDVIVAPDDDGEYPDDMLVSCGQGVFPIGALDDIQLLSQADQTGITEAITPFLANEEGRHWPQEGWQILHQTDEDAHLVARSEHGGLAHMYLTDDGSGWSWSGASLAGDPCRLEFVVPEELNTVEWRLDSEAGSPSPESTTVDIILHERDCVDGREIGERLLGPQIVMSESKVFIAFAAERPEGDAFTCPGNPDMPYTVQLPAPIGERELVEGLEIGISLEDHLD